MKPKVLVLGDVCIDKFIYGHCKRLCPEAPVPVFNPIRETSNLGMAGNVFSNLKSLANSTCDVDFIFSTPCSSFKTRYIDEASGYTLLRVDEFDSNARITKAQIERAANDYCGVVIADYNKGFLTEEDISAISQIAEEKSVPTFLDTKKILGQWSKDITFVKINEKEYTEQLSRCPRISQSCKNLIVTMGEKGALWENKGIIIPTPKVEVKNVSGAGDTFHAAFALSYMQANPIEKAIEYANKAAAVCVIKQGVVTVTPEDVGIV